MKTEDSQRRHRTSHFYLMLENNIEEMVKVNFVNLAAFAVSISDFSELVKLLVMIASLVYTVTKIVQTVQEIKAKKK
jgi:hypothetical protein